METYKGSVRAYLTSILGVVPEDRIRVTVLEGTDPNTKQLNVDFLARGADELNPFALKAEEYTSLFQSELAGVNINSTTSTCSGSSLCPFIIDTDMLYRDGVQKVQGCTYIQATGTSAIRVCCCWSVSINRPELATVV